MTRPSLAFDLETYGERKKEALQPMRGDARLLTLCIPGKTVSFDLKASGYSSADWPAIFRDREAIAHNARFDAAWVPEKLGVRLSPVFCTLTACQLLSQGDRTIAKDLGAALERYVGVKISKGFGKSDWGGMFLVDAQIRYAAEDVQHLHALRDKLEEELRAAKLWGTFQLEMLLLPVVVDMQSAGIPISRDRLNRVLEEAEIQRKENADQLKTQLGWINLDSPDQVLKAFKGVGVDLPDTKEETLKECLHPAAETLLEYRAKEKVCQQVETLREAICSDGRIHAEFKPMGTDTGRFASASPNMQNIGRGLLRSCFTPSAADKVFVVADYSQIELRVGAVISRDPTMLSSLRSKEDLHTKTASIVLHKNLKDVTKADRQTAKAVNFGLLYGQQAPGLVRYAKANYGVVLELEEAVRLRAAFFKHYRGVAAWHKGAWNRESTATEVRTVIGRRRLLPTEPDKKWLRFAALVNTPVQGTSADCLKLAMVELAPKLARLGARMVATVHDELVIECQRDNAEEVRGVTVEIMIGAASRILNNAVPIEVEAKICENWGDK